MAASKRLIQLGSRLRAIHVVSTTNTPTLRRTSVNSHRLLSSSSSFHESECCKKQDQGLAELASLRSEITKLQSDIGKMREKLENMDKALHPKNMTKHLVREMSDETKRLISEAKETAMKYLDTLLEALGIFLICLIAFPFVLFLAWPGLAAFLFLLLLFSMVSELLSECDGNRDGGKSKKD